MMTSEHIRCTRCNLPATYKNINFDSDGVCNYCHEAEKHTDLKTLLTFDNDVV